MERVQVVIVTPLESELVDRLRDLDDRLDIAFEPELLPPPRYPSDHRGVDEFARTPAEEERFTALVSGAEVALGFPREEPAGLAWVIRTAPRLRFLQATYAGAGQQVRAAGLTADELDRVAIASSAGIHATPLAEWSIFGILAFAKGLTRLLDDKAHRRWEHYPTRELTEQTLLVIGVGEIGSEVVRLARAFGMTVLGIKREAGGEWAGPDRLGELVERADAVVVTLPLTAETAGLVDRETIERMRDGAVFVNVGRGGVVDEQALTEALRSGRLRGAALDVFADEPLPESSPLWELDNVIVSPHTAALSVKENERIVELFGENLRRYLAGEELISRVRANVFY
ncbi:MAG: D-2-hydroxyacid dehydrogenase [Gaiellaceae bacterium]